MKGNARKFLFLGFSGSLVLHAQFLWTGFSLRPARAPGDVTAVRLAYGCDPDPRNAPKAAPDSAKKQPKPEDAPPKPQEKPIARPEMAAAPQPIEQRILPSEFGESKGKGTASTAWDDPIPLAARKGDTDQAWLSRDAVGPDARPHGPAASTDPKVGARMNSANTFTGTPLMQGASAGDQLGAAPGPNRTPTLPKKPAPEPQQPRLPSPRTPENPPLLARATPPHPPAADPKTIAPPIARLDLPKAPQPKTLEPKAPLPDVKKPEAPKTESSKPEAIAKAPSEPLTLVKPPAPSPSEAAANDGPLAQVRPDLVKPSAPGQAQGAGAPGASADPAPQSDMESDPFSAKPLTVEIRPGGVAAQLGRKVKPIRPQIGDIGMMDLAMSGAPIVTVKVEIDAEGKVTDAKIIHGLGKETVDTPVLLAMYEWWIEPLKNKAGKPVPSAMFIQLVWR